MKILIKIILNLSLGTKIQEKLEELENKIKDFENFNALIQKKFFNNDII